MTRSSIMKNYKDKLHEFERLLKDYEKWNVEHLPKDAIIRRKKLVREAKKILVANRKALIAFSLGKGNIDQEQLTKSFNAMDKLIDQFVEKGIFEKEKA